MPRRGQETGEEVSGTAVELVKLAEQRLGTLALGRGDVSVGVDEIIAELTEVGKANLLRQLFAGMSQTEQYQVLAGTYDDEGIRAVLAEEYRIASEGAQLKRTMDRMQTEARRQGIVDASRVMPFSRLQLDLHDVGDFESAGDFEQLRANGAIADWKIVVSALGGGEFRVLESGVTDFPGHKTRKPRQLLAPHEIVRIGSPDPRTDGGLVSVLHWGAPISMITGEFEPEELGLKGIDLALGGAWVNSEHLFYLSDE